MHSHLEPVGDAPLLPPEGGKERQARPRARSLDYDDFARDAALALRMLRIRQRVTNDSCHPEPSKDGGRPTTWASPIIPASLPQIPRLRRPSLGKCIGAPLGIRRETGRYGVGVSGGGTGAMISLAVVGGDFV